LFSYLFTHLFRYLFSYYCTKFAFLCHLCGTTCNHQATPATISDGHAVCGATSPCFQGPLNFHRGDPSMGTTDKKNIISSTCSTDYTLRGTHSDPWHGLSTFVSVKVRSVGGRKKQGVRMRVFDNICSKMICICIRS
jgi:hypothetical protein